MKMSFDDKNNVKNIDEAKLRKLKFKILFEEKSNLRTRKKTNNEMIKFIRQAIMDVVNE